jgi:hypothetical protein
MMTKSTSTKVVTLNLRLPSRLHKQLTKGAAEGHRSLNAEILARLDDSLCSRWGEASAVTIKMKDLIDYFGAKHNEELEALRQRIDTVEELAAPKKSKRDL